MKLKTISKEQFLYICEIMNGVECALYTFRANILCGIIWHPTKLDEKEFSRSIQALSDKELADIYDRVLAFWDTREGFNIDNRLKEIGVRFHEKC